MWDRANFFSKVTPLTFLITDNEQRLFAEKIRPPMLFCGRKIQLFHAILGLKTNNSRNRNRPPFFVTHFNHMQRRRWFYQLGCLIWNFEFLSQAAYYK